MRLSTSALHTKALALMLRQQSALARTQEQIGTGKRVLSPADDPIAAVHILRLERALAESEQFARNAALANSRIALEETALADAGNVLQRIRELVVQANSATVDAEGRAMIAAEVRERIEEMMDIANRRDSAGEHLFAGYSALTQPFVREPGGVSYRGDQGTRMIQIAPTQRIADGHNGFEVFANILEGNGTFVVRAGAANTGTAVLGSTSVADVSAWVPGTYTLRFTSETTWEVTDGASTVVASGSYASGGSVEFNGAQLTLTGTPAAGDTFTIASSGREDIFTTLDGILSSLLQPVDSPALRAQLSTKLGNALQQLDRASSHLLDIRAEVGARLNTLERAEQAREEIQLQLQQSLSDLRDLDYAEAVARMNQQLVGLEAAQLTYSKISQLSLFDYL